MSCVQFSRTCVEMVAIQISRSGSGMAFDTRPRPLRMDAPLLSMESGHASHVRLGWPLALMHAKLRLASPHLRHAVAVELLDRFRRHFTPEWVIERMRVSAADRPSMHVNRRRRTDEQGPTMWLVLPFHPCMCRTAVQRAVAGVLENPWFALAWRASFAKTPPRVRISWKNVLPPYAVLVQRRRAKAVCG